MTDSHSVDHVLVAKTLASEAKWAELMKLTDNDSLRAAHSRVLRWRVIAATALGNVAAVREAAEQGITANLQPLESFALVREVAAGGAITEAINLLLSKKGLEDHPHFQRAAARLSRKSHNADEKHQLQAAIFRSSKGGSAVKPTRSEIGFKTPSEPATPIGSAEIFLSSITSSEHKIRLTRERDRFIELVRKHSSPIVNEYCDVFINRKGQVWTEAGSIIVQRGDIIPTLDRSSAPNIDIGFSMLTGTRGIYHWLVDQVPLLSGLLVSENATTVPILIADNAPAFEADTLSLMGIEGDRSIAVGDAVFVRRLLIANVKMAALSEWSRFEKTLEPLIANALAKAEAASLVFSDKIYISRRLAKRRSLINEARVEEIAQARGFEVVIFEQMPLWQQIACVQHALVIMAPHGAGLAHLILAAQGTRVLEILPIKSSDTVYLLRWNYARLSLARGHVYSAWLEEQGISADSWQVQTGEFEKFLDDHL